MKFGVWITSNLVDGNKNMGVALSLPQPHEVNDYRKLIKEVTELKFVMWCPSDRVTIIHCMLVSQWI